MDDIFVYGNGYMRAVTVVVVPAAAALLAHFPPSATLQDCSSMGGKLGGGCYSGEAAAVILRSLHHVGSLEAKLKPWELPQKVSEGDGREGRDGREGGVVCVCAPIICVCRSRSRSRVI